MTGNTLGEIFRVTTWGESHGESIGCVIDGCPAGLEIDEGFFIEQMSRDIPYPVLSKRFEKNQVKVLSGVHDGMTIGTPISILIENTDVKSATYRGNRYIPRPGHADLSYKVKYGHVDWRGGSRASGRTWISVTAAGAVARKLCGLSGITIESRITKLGSYETNEKNIKEIVDRIADDFKNDRDPTGGSIEVRISGLPPGLGAPMFSRFQSEIGRGILDIPGVRSFILGNGLKNGCRASEFNDGIVQRKGDIVYISNNAAGVLGGITTGKNMFFSFDVKPTPSTSVPQKSVDLNTWGNTSVSSQGRFDTNFVPRVLVIAEAISGIITVDHLMLSSHLPHDSLIATEDRMDIISDNDEE